MPEDMYDFFELPAFHKELYRNLLESDYKNGKRIESRAMDEFRRQNNIPTDRQLIVSQMDFVVNGEKIC